ncbi:hypothetical protein FM112_13645 [Gulosibacter sp. 10]|nr:hypothetical protein FM112_13645 [Gulosibacter sp. 10]
MIIVPLRSAVPVILRRGLRRFRNSFGQSRPELLGDTDYRYKVTLGTYA